MRLTRISLPDAWSQLHNSVPESISLLLSLQADDKRLEWHHVSRPEFLQVVASLSTTHVVIIHGTMGLWLHLPPPPAHRCTARPVRPPRVDDWNGLLKSTPQNEDIAISNACPATRQSSGRGALLTS